MNYRDKQGERCKCHAHHHNQVTTVSSGDTRCEPRSSSNLPPFHTHDFLETIFNNFSLVCTKSDKIGGDLSVPASCSVSNLIRKSLVAPKSFLTGNR